METYYLKKTSTGISIRFQLSDASGAYDLTNCTVYMNLRDSKDRSIKLSLVACTVENQTTAKGWVHYDWQTTDVNTSSVFNMDCKVVLPNSKPVYWPFGESNEFAQVTIQNIIA